MVYMALIREKKKKSIPPPPPRIPSILSHRVVTKNVPPVDKEQHSSIKTLWSHLVFVSPHIRKIGNNRRIPTIVYGLFNQLFALFAVVDITKILGRSKLVIGHFYVNFHNTKDSVPLSKVVQLGSLLVPTMDWDRGREPTLSSPFRTNSLSLYQKQDHVRDLEIGCCFMFPLPEHDRGKHIRNLRFHPIFYEIISPFLQSYPQYQVVHYRMENDFSQYFYKSWHFTTHEQCRQNLYQQYQKKIKQEFNPTIPTLVVSHYYKDPHQHRDHDLQWENLIHFRLTPPQRNKLCEHLQLPASIPMREVDAIFDFILCTTPNVQSFIGCGGSTFSGSVREFHIDKIPCAFVHPIKPSS